MTPDDLDTKSLEELDEIFAVEVAETPLAQFQAQRRFGQHARYSSSADAVLPWLEKHGVEIHRIHRIKAGYVWEVSVYNDGNYFPVEATAPTFPHAAVKALIRAERAKKGNL